MNEKRGERAVWGCINTIIITTSHYRSERETMKDGRGLPSSDAVHHQRHPGDEGRPGNGRQRLEDVAPYHAVLIS